MSALRPMRFAALWALIVAMALTSFTVLAQTGTALVAVPAYKSYVTDLSNTLQPAERAQIEARLAAIEQQTGSQVAVLLLPTVQPEDIAAYAIRVADAWKVGRKKVDDGVILIVATQDRKLRIEVGRGLEGAIPDAIAKRIISETIAPAFKGGNMAVGIAAGVEQIAASIKGEALPAPEQRRNASDASSISGFLPIIIIAIIMLMGVFRRKGGRGFYASRRGSGLGGFAAGMVLDSLLRGGGRGGGGWGGGGGGGGFGGGGGGGFGGGGASGDW